MKKNINANAQGGFTLIELIVVIVILGILAATALPKFVNLGADARLASMQAARGALTSTAAMVHGKSLVNPSATTVDVEGTSVALSNSYPSATVNFATAAGLSDDYIVKVTTAGLTITPKSLAETSDCNVKYVAASAANTPPTFTINATAANCN